MDELLDTLAERTGYSREWLKAHLDELGYTEDEIRADIDDCVDTLRTFLDA